MNEREQRPAEMRNITRERGDVGWTVAVRRTHPKPITYRRTFLDHRHGDGEGALRAAQAGRGGAGRDEIIERHPPAGYEPRISNVARTNTSGKTGVMRRVRFRKRKDGSIRQICRWVARPPPGITPARSKGFSVERFGGQEGTRIPAVQEQYLRQDWRLAAYHGDPRQERQLFSPRLLAGQITFRHFAGTVQELFRRKIWRSGGLPAGSGSADRLRAIARRLIGS